MLGQKIVLLREQQNMTRKELAEKLNITYHALAKYETNDRTPDPEVILAIANLFDVTTDYLLGKTNKNNQSLYIADPESTYGNKSKNLSDELLSHFITQIVPIMIRRETELASDTSPLLPILKSLHTKSRAEQLKIFNHAIQRVHIDKNNVLQFELRSVSEDDILEIAKSLPPHKRKALIKSLIDIEDI